MAAAASSTNVPGPYDTLAAAATRRQQKQQCTCVRQGTDGGEACAAARRDCQEHAKYAHGDLLHRLLAWRDSQDSHWQGAFWQSRYGRARNVEASVWNTRTLSVWLQSRHPHLEDPNASSICTSGPHCDLMMSSCWSGFGKQRWASGTRMSSKRGLACVCPAPKSLR